MKRGGADVAIAALRDVQKTLDRLAEVPRKLAIAAAPDITELLQSQFDVGVNPYGERWRPLRPRTLAKGRRNPPLTDTGKLRSGTKARPSPRGNTAGLQVVLGAKYGAFHQVGFRVGKTKVAPRRVLPNRGLPKAWRGILVQRARELARKAVA
jgi:phage gpG-like protein